MNKKKLGNQPLVHRLKHSIRLFDEMKHDNKLKGKFKCPKDLTIITCHNYADTPLLIQNLEYLGINYVELKVYEKVWEYAYKTEKILTYLKDWGKANRTSYVLVLDANDVIFLDDPQRTIDLFKKKKCNVLFGSTMFKGGYVCMPDKLEWYRQIGGTAGRYLNAGVFIGKWDALIELLNVAMKYSVAGFLPHKEYVKLGRGTKTIELCEALPEFPKGAPDQIIYRYIYDMFYPDIQVDHYNELCYRN